MSAINNSHSLSTVQLKSKYNFNTWLFFSVTFIISALPFYDGIAVMVRQWINQEEYSHGFFLPVIAVFMVWQKRFELQKLVLSGSYFGVGLVALGLFLSVMGELATVFEIIEYGFVITLSGLTLSLVGIYPFKYFVLPLTLLFFMVPLPNFLYNNLSAELQLISSKIGVFVIRLFDIPVYLQGNVIDLGKFKLQVVEACSGLRYLFPLTALTFIIVCFYRAPLIFKLIVFISSAPITILMNSLRIALIGIAYHFFGFDLAQGILHDFEGWVVFMGSMILIFIEIKLLALMTGNKESIAELIPLNIPQPQKDESSTIPVTRKISKPFYVSLTLILLFNVLVFILPDRQEVMPDRTEFSFFPTVINGWVGHREFLSGEYLRVLKLSDYFLANYSNYKDDTVNFYSAYYNTQRKGISAHSPKSCLPGDGWEIVDFRAIKIIDGMTVNRAVIARGEEKSLLYYWFDQRGRILNNEYMVKWYMFWDALVKNRTDGALLRLTTNVRPGENISAAENRLQTFLSAIEPRLNEYIPD